MKVRLLVIAAIAFLGMGLQSCTNEENDVLADDVQQEVTVPEAVQTLFEASFPAAQNVTWEKKSELLEAEFSVENAAYNAWFEKEGTWKLTRTGMNLGKQGSGLPQAIQDYIATNYPAWTIDDIDFIKTSKDEYYEIELEKRGEPEVTLFIRADGTLINSFVKNVNTTGTDVNSSAIPAAVVNAFNERYPKALRTKWEREGSQYEAEFILDNAKSEAFFRVDGTWLRTETEINLQTATLPQAIKEYLSANYAGWSIDDADFIQTPADEYYDLDLEKRNEQDVTLQIRADGTLLNTVNNNGTSHNNDNDLNMNSVPTAVRDAFSGRYPGAQQVEWERNAHLYEAEFVLNGVEYEAWFQADGTWVRTKSEINLRTATLPQAVKNYVAANYSGWSIDDADFIQTPTDEYYELELEKKGQQDVKLRIRPDGTVINS